MDSDIVFLAVLAGWLSIAALITLVLMLADSALYSWKGWSVINKLMGV